MVALVEPLQLRRAFFLKQISSCLYDACGIATAGRCVPEKAYCFSSYIFTQSISICTGYSSGRAFPTQLPSICMSMSR